MSKFLRDILDYLTSLNTPTKISCTFLALALVFASPSISSLVIQDSDEPMEEETVDDKENVAEILKPESIKVKFILYSSRNSKPISDANVQFIFDGAPENRRTDSNGYTSIEIPYREEVEVRITKEGFNELKQNINLNADTDKTVTYYLEPTELDPPKNDRPEITEPTPQSLFPKRKISLDIPQKKPDGKNWDGYVGKEPDPVLCITTQDGYTYCLPDGTGTNVENISDSLCSNTYSCSTIAPVPDGELEIQLVDNDVSDNDTIGSGFCSVGKTCKIGEATISISQ